MNLNRWRTPGFYHRLNVAYGRRATWFEPRWCGQKSFNRRVKLIKDWQEVVLCEKDPEPGSWCQNWQKVATAYWDGDANGICVCLERDALDTKLKKKHVVEFLRQLDPAHRQVDMDKLSAAVDVIDHTLDSLMMEVEDGD